MKQTSSFLPAAPVEPLIRLAWFLNRWLVLPYYLKVRVVLEPDDLERLKSLKGRKGLLLASNHPSYTDPMVLGELMRLSNRPSLFVATRAIFDRWAGAMGWMMQRLGTFSVAPGGHGNVSATRYAVENLREGRFPIAIFPEGHTFYVNDLLLALRPGVASWAIEAAASGASVQILPIAIRYRYLHDISGPLDRAVASLEHKLHTHAPEIPPGDFWSRLYLRLFHLGDVVLRRLERHYHFRPHPLADVDERMEELAYHLLGILEQKHFGRSGQGDGFTRAVALMRRIQAATNPVDFRTAHLAWSLSMFRAGYLRPDSTPERFAETVMKIHREVFDRVPLALKMTRVACVRIGIPLEAGDYLARNDTPQAAVTNLMTDLASRLQSMISGSVKSAEQIDLGDGLERRIPMPVPP